MAFYAHDYLWAIYRKTFGLFKGVGMPAPVVIAIMIRKAMCGITPSVVLFVLSRSFSVALQNGCVAPMQENAKRILCIGNEPVDLRRCGGWGG